MNYIDLDAINSWKFPGGEVGVKLAPLENKSTKVYARLRNSDDIMKLVMVDDVINQLYEKGPKWYGKQLVIPYVPYGRQDRICNPGESFSLRAFANLINGLGYDKVTVYDMHSKVTKEYIENCVNISAVAFNLWALDKLKLTKPIVVAADKGAIHRAHNLCEYISADYIVADKKREMSTGKIVSYEVEGDVAGLDCVVPDDILDGGNTYIELAKQLRKKGARSVHLFVSHGIFSRGLKVLYDAGIDTVCTTNSYYRDKEFWFAAKDIESGLFVGDSHLETWLNLDEIGHVYNIHNEI